MPSILLLLWVLVLLSKLLLLSWLLVHFYIMVIIVGLLLFIETMEIQYRVMISKSYYKTNNEKRSVLIRAWSLANQRSRYTALWTDQTTISNRGQTQFKKQEKLWTFALKQTQACNEFTSPFVFFFFFFTILQQWDQLSFECPLLVYKHTHRQKMLTQKVHTTKIESVFDIDGREKREGTSRSIIADLGAVGEDGLEEGEVGGGIKREIEGEGAIYKQMIGHRGFDYPLYRFDIHRSRDILQLMPCSAPSHPLSIVLFYNPLLLTNAPSTSPIPHPHLSVVQPREIYQIFYPPQVSSEHTDSWIQRQLQTRVFKRSALYLSWKYSVSPRPKCPFVVPVLPFF